jgi:hypothetical protein
MKKIFILILSVGLAIGASAQRIGHGGFYGGAYYYRPSVVVGVGGYAPFFPYPYFGYGPYYPYPYGYGYNMPSKMDVQVMQIKNDCSDKIASVKMDSTLTHKEKREKIHDLRADRDKRIHDLKANYYKN